MSVDRRMHFCRVESESEVRHIRSFKNAVGFLQRLHQFPISRAVNGDLSHSVSPSTLAIPCALRFSHAGGCLLTLDYAFKSNRINLFHYAILCFFVAVLHSPTAVFIIES